MPLLRRLLRPLSALLFWMAEPAAPAKVVRKTWIAGTASDRERPGRSRRTGLRVRRAYAASLAKTPR
jgi:hypothetical protein